MQISNLDLDFWNYDPKIYFWVNLGQESQSCPFWLKIGTHGISRMLIIIPTLVFWISKPKFIFWQIWTEKVKVACFVWKWTHTHTHTYIVSRRCWFLFRYRFSQMSNLNLEDSDSYSEISFLKLQIKLETPKSIFWANLSRKNWILPFAWKLVHRVSCGCECKVTDQGLEAKIKMNNCNKCLLLLYFHRS